MRLRATRAPAVLALAFAACAEPVASPDAATPDDAATPTVVALPSWGSCPEGWSPRELDGASVCAPPARVACDATSFQRVASAACEPVDDACASAGFRAALPTDRAVVYVDASVAATGDGSEAHPFQTLDEALATGTSPVGIALAAGSYTQTRPFPADVALYGACAATVRLVGAPQRAAVVVTPGARAHLEGLTLHADDFGVASGGELVMRHVIVDQARIVGIGALGGSADLRDVLVRDTRSAADGTYGRGISFSMSARGVIDDVVVEGAREGGVSVDGATLDATRLVVRHTLPNGQGMYGVGLANYAGATTTLRESLITGSAALGLQNDSATLTIDRVVVVGEAMDTIGLMHSSPGGQTFLTRALFDDAAGTAVLLSGAGATLEASDVAVTGTRPVDSTGAGMSASAGSHMTLARVAVLDTGGVGVAVLDARLDASDLHVHRITEAFQLGEALLVAHGATLDLDRFDVREPRVIGVMVTGASSSATLRHGTVADVGEGLTFDVGRGIEVDRDAMLALEDVVVRGVVETGILSYGEDVAGTTLTLTRVRVEDIRERACVSSTCPTEGGGTGITALAGGAIHATALEVDGAPLCGVQVAEDGRLDIVSGTVSRSAIGACVQVAGYDLTRILGGVAFVDDQRNLETASVYVPPRAPAP